MAIAPGHWHLGVGQPGALPWMVVACYVVALAVAGSAFAVARRSCRVLAGRDERESRRQRELSRLFLAVAAIMFVLWLNRQFDLQTAVIDRMRRIAWEGGWYQRRREYQAEVITGLVVVGALVGGAIALLLRRIVGRVALVLLGIGLLTVFVVVRAISFHYVDELLRRGGRFGLNLTIELGLLLLIVAGTVKWHLDERRLVAAALAAQPSDSLALSIP